MSKVDLKARSFYNEVKCLFPLYLSSVKAGFPSPADDYIDKSLDLNEFLIEHKEATFFLKVSGDSMKDASINSGDIIIVDRSKNFKENDIVVVAIDGELTVKRIIKIKNKWFLKPENTEFNLIPLNPEMDIRVWGKVTYVIHKV